MEDPPLEALPGQLWHLESPKVHQGWGVRTLEVGVNPHLCPGGK